MFKHTKKVESNNRAQETKYLQSGKIPILKVKRRKKQFL